MFIIFSVFYILIAAAMTVLILIQRGEGANAGASFGGGSSGTVFGASGSASFLSRTTGVLFTLFIALSLGMAIYLAHSGAPTKSTDLGVMAGMGATTTQSTDAQTVPATTGSAAQAAPAAPVTAPATTTETKPTATDQAEAAASEQAAAQKAKEPSKQN